MTKIAHKENILRWMKEKPVDNLHFVFVSTGLTLDYWLRHFHFPIVYLHYLVWQRLAYRRSVELHREKNFDLVHHTSYGSLQLGSHLWKLNIPFVFGPLSGGQTVPPLLQPYLDQGRLKERLRLWISKRLLYQNERILRILRNTYLVLAANQETYDLLKNLRTHRLSFVLDAGISKDFIPTSYPARPVRPTMHVLWVGRLVSHKGFSVVLKVFESLGQQYPIRLNVIGEGPLAHYYRQKVRALELADTITFRSRLPFNELKQHYATSDIFMFCGLRNSLGIQVLEAMAYGLPLIGLNQHGAKTFIPDNASIKVDLVEDHQIIEDLKQALITLYLNPDERTRRGKNAYHWAQQHTWSRKVASVSEQYQRSLGT
jgi:glycosyltransferase involved in cell wall biosynthesis